MPVTGKAKRQASFSQIHTFSEEQLTIVHITMTNKIICCHTYVL